MSRWIYVDIDGTLTRDPANRWGEPIVENIEAVRELSRSSACRVVLWSGGGGGYAAEFAKRYGLDNVVAVGKPDVVVDDSPDRIRPNMMLAPITEPGLLMMMALRWANRG